MNYINNNLTLEQVAKLRKFDDITDAELFALCLQRNGIDSEIGEVNSLNAQSKPDPFDLKIGSLIIKDIQYENIETIEKAILSEPSLQTPELSDKINKALKESKQIKDIYFNIGKIEDLSLPDFELFPSDVTKTVNYLYPNDKLSELRKTNSISSAELLARCLQKEGFNAETGCIKPIKKVPWISKDLLSFDPSYQTTFAVNGNPVVIFDYSSIEDVVDYLSKNPNMGKIINSTNFKQAVKNAIDIERNNGPISKVAYSYPNNDDHDPNINTKSKVKISPTEKTLQKQKEEVSQSKTKQQRMH